MTAPPQWIANPAVQQAVQARDYATIRRFSRLAAGLTLEQLGAAGGYSTSTLSRLESGRRAVRDVSELRMLADLYDVPMELFGLATTSGPVSGSTLAATLDGGGDTVRRRKFLAGAAAVGATAALPATPAAAAPTGHTIEDVLFGRLTAEPLPGQLHDNGMACATADRAVQAAAAGNDPLIMAESRRLAATVLRRVDHRGSAQHLALEAAEQLRTSISEPGTAFHAMYGKLLAVAAYTAAIRDDRDTAWMLLSEAERPAHAAGASAQFNVTELAVYRISVARKLGDYGAAVDYARKVAPRSITDPERRARYSEDTALALQGRGRPTAAFDALLAAERDVPEEVRYRPWSQQLTRDLLSAPASHSLPGVRDFATRIGVV